MGMHVAVLGSGVVGVATAWYLAQNGHQVTVIDRQPAPGMETSFANAGQVSPGLSAPFAAPDTPAKALRWLFMRHGPLVFRPWEDPAMAPWLLQFLANCTPAAYATNKARMVRLAEYSRDKLRDLRHVTGITYDDRQRGLLELFRTQAQLDGVTADTAVLDTLCVPYKVLDRAGAIAQEPGLAHANTPIAGGLLLPGDESGDALLFTERLATLAAEAGVVFRTNTAIKRLRAEAGKITGIETADSLITADHYVLCTGSYSPALLRPLGIKLPVYPVKGYSITLGIKDAARAPVSTLGDATYKTGITRLGDRIRVAGTAELAGFSKILREERRQALLNVVNTLFPGAADATQTHFWTGLRPMTPDGTPVVGATPLDNLWLNTGHGTLGWTMACGSGALVADLVSGRVPNIEHADLGISRYR